ncbi:DUF1810 domain-containing protein [Luteimonas sp. SDU101]|uniref:DUF1810 domain-containing protein n=1 Tax=Luteimonas sp. SDU101 TaxID=3422593 RepID=UPI003EBB2958
MSGGLARFVDAQAGVHAQALDEIRAGRKRTHWMWFVFPQLRGLGQSASSMHYGIDGVGEARAYLAHPVLGPRLEAATRCVLDTGQPPARIFGELDAMKFRSCMTLFANVSAPGSVFHAALHALAGEDPLTLALLEGRPEARD